MAQQEVSQCGLDFTQANLRMNDTKHFGPEKYRANTADVYCAFTTCPLAAGIEVRFSAIAGETTEEVKGIFEEAATDPQSRISEQLRQVRFTQCPSLKAILG